ncbi:hypothetical protein BASA50_004005 [Batrachochytrium salamandrivorans]|uniref:F-box domain-containing protein n=1 Tax=Batrachochytrium salamandrivorans TaxID=1357716 RepID=A0ABQ8FGZ7_9FUNG|nr:hypothetical protein BASA50_004005 [Batrachochytrium salamandrivorans]
MDIHHLPIELLQSILAYLTLQDYLTVRRLSRSLQAAIESLPGWTSTLIRVTRTGSLPSALAAIASDGISAWSTYFSLDQRRSQLGSEHVGSQRNLHDLNDGYGLSRRVVWLVHDIVHHRAVVMKLQLIWSALATRHSDDSNGGSGGRGLSSSTPGDLCLVMRLSTYACFSYTTDVGVALMIEAVGAPMGDCTSMYKGVVRLDPPLRYHQHRDGSPKPTRQRKELRLGRVCPLFIPRMLSVLYTTDDYGCEPKLRAEVAAGTAASRRLLLRHLAVSSRSGLSSSSSSTTTQDDEGMTQMVELWFRGGSTQAFLIEQCRLIESGAVLVITASFKREWTFTLKRRDRSTDCHGGKCIGGCRCDRRCDGFDDCLAKFDSTMRALSVYWSQMASFDIGCGVLPHMNLAGRLQTDV